MRISDWSSDVCSSDLLLRTLFAHDLVDQLNLLIFPVVLGKGKRLFESGAAPGAFTLSESKVATTGVIIAAYRRAGEVPTGSFALDEPTEAELKRRDKLQTAASSASRKHPPDRRIPRLN